MSNTYIVVDATGGFTDELPHDDAVDCKLEWEKMGFGPCKIIPWSTGPQPAPTGRDDEGLI